MAVATLAPPSVPEMFLFLCSNQKYSQIESLLERGFSVDTPNEEGNTTLHYAAWNRKNTVIKYLLSKGANPHCKNNRGEFPIHWAIMGGDTTSVHLLSRYYPDFNINTTRGFSLLHLAVQNGNLNVVHYLFTLGAVSNVNATDSEGNTALHWATLNGDRNSTLYLLSKSADINCTGKDGYTPLHLAIRQNHTSTAQLLLKHGANFNLPDQSSKTAQDNLQESPSFNKDKKLLLQTMKQSFFFKPEKKSFRLIFLSCFLAISYWISLLLLTSSVWSAGLFVGFLGFVYINIMQLMNSEEFLPGLFWGASLTAIYLYFKDVEYRSNNTLECYIFLLFTTISYFGYIYLLFSDPGYIIIKDSEKEKQAYFKTIEDEKEYRICPTCHIRKPLRSKHCAVLNKCIAKFDHYCPWLCNSIGYNNHFIFFLWLTCVIIFGILFIYYGFKSITTNSSAYLFPVTFVNTLLFFCCAFVVLYMYFIQLRGILKNETTNELIHRVFWSHNHNNQLSEYQNPFDKGIVNNIKEFILGFEHKDRKNTIGGGNGGWDSIFEVEVLEDVVAV